MSFDEESNEVGSSQGGESEKKKPKTFFGMELSDGVVYTIVVILTIIFIRQVSLVLQALS